LPSALPNDMSGLRLRFQSCWAITSRRWDPELGLAALPILAGHDAVLYLEGGPHSEEVAGLLNAHSIPAVERIERGTMSPRPQIYHLPAAVHIFEGLSQLAGRCALPEICDHLVIYRPALVIVDWYDAFDREVYVSSSVAEELIREFAEILDASYRMESC
jgi:hypothetical protein